MARRTRSSPIDPLNVPTGVMARLLGISSNTLTKYTSDGRVSKNDRGKYDLEDTIQGYIRYATGKADALPQQRQKLVTEQQRKLKLANDKAAGKLIDTSVASGIWSEVLSILRSGLVSLPGRNASRLAGMSNVKEIRALLNGEINDFLAHAEAAIPELVEIDEETAANDAAGSTSVSAQAG